MSAHCPTGAIRVAGAKPKPRARAFTLIELLLAVVIFGIVLAAINTVFYGALRLRARVSDALDFSDSLNQALTFLRRDLQNITLPGGVMSVSFKIGTVGTGAGVPQAPGIEFYCSTGVISDNAPWGDIKKVTYQLRNPLNVSQARGKDLVRSVCHNLLATTTEDPDERSLMSNVERLDFAGYTGTTWQDSWDTTLSDTNLPTAIRVRIQLAADNLRDSQSQPPIEMIVPLTLQALTNQNLQSTSGGGL